MTPPLAFMNSLGTLIGACPYGTWCPQALKELLLHPHVTAGPALHA
jgi:hypothetical protein